MAAPGILLVDKPGGITSHDVVARARSALGTRKIGHAGTLDPMATGLLVLGVEGATRLLTFIVGLDKTYEATIRLGAATDTDDAEGEIIETTDASALDLRTTIAAGRSPPSRGADLAGAEPGVGDQGRRPARVRPRPRGRGGRAQGPRRHRVAVRRPRRAPRRTDSSISTSCVDCSSGTYIRALARDLGASLGVGGHLTALRRTRIGPFDVAGRGIRRRPRRPPCSSTRRRPPSAVLGRLDVTADEARDLRHGKRLAGAASRLGATPDARRSTRTARSSGSSSAAATT